MDMDYTVGEVELTYKSTSKSRNKIYSSEDAYEVLLSTYREGTICYKEYFKVLFLNQAKQVLGYTLISEGGITETCADVRVILQAALLTNSVAIILAHNHPSGNLKPSRQDMEITKQVKDAAQLMRITVIDHLILTDAGYYSFADEENYNKVKGTQFPSWVSLSYSLLLLVNVPLVISELVNPTQN